MKPATFLLFLTLFGGDPSAAPSGLAAKRPSMEQVTQWAGVWLVGERRVGVVAVIRALRGGERLSARLRFDETTAQETGEEWTGAFEGQRIHLTRAEGGEAVLVPVERTNLSGRLTRRHVTAMVTLRPEPATSAGRR
jgi:hypothetical protein